MALMTMMADGEGVLHRMKLRAQWPQAQRVG